MDHRFGRVTPQIPNGQLRTSTHDGVLRVEGELDLDSAPHLASAIHACEPGRPLRIDMSGVTFIDSSAISQLVRAARERPVTIVKASPVVQRLLEIVGLRDRFGVE